MFPIHLLLSSETVEELLFVGYIRDSQLSLSQIIPSSVIHACFVYYFEPLPVSHLTDKEIERMVCQVLVENDSGNYAQQLLDEVHQQTTSNHKIHPKFIDPSYKLLLSKLNKKQCMAKLFHMNYKPNFQQNMFKLCVFLFNLRQNPMKLLNVKSAATATATTATTTAVSAEKASKKLMLINGSRSQKTPSTKKPAIPKTTAVMAHISQTLLLQFDDDINDYLVYVNKIFHGIINFSTVMYNRIAHALTIYPLIAGVYVDIYQILSECGRSLSQIQDLCTNTHSEEELHTILDLLQFQRTYFLRKVNKYERKLRSTMLVKQKQNIKQETRSLRTTLIFRKKQMELQESKYRTEIKMAQNNFEQQLLQSNEKLERMKEDMAEVQMQLKMQQRMQRQHSSSLKLLPRLSSGGVVRPKSIETASARVSRSTTTTTITPRNHSSSNSSKNQNHNKTRTKKSKSNVVKKKIGKKKKSY